MSNSGWQRYAPVSGIVFVVLFIVGIMLIELPSSDDSAQEVISFYNDSGNRTQILIGGYLLMLSAVFFFWFLASLRSRLLGAEGAPGRLTSIAFGSGLVFTALLMAAACAFMSIAGNIEFGDEKVPGADLARFLPELGYPLLLIAGMFAAIAMIDATSVLIIRTRTLPGWIGWYGFVAAVLLLGAVVFFPIIFLLLWVLFVSVALLRLEPAATPD